MENLLRRAATLEYVVHQKMEEAQKKYSSAHDRARLQLFFCPLGEERGKRTEGAKSERGEKSESGGSFRRIETFAHLSFFIRMKSDKRKVKERREFLMFRTRDQKVWNLLKELF